uniref:Dihydroorotase, mitochondrial n=1 Tax=Aplanochytrium stocchinoi TaxID=215587 RepID=A0A7S3PJN2_9STRA
MFYLGLNSVKLILLFSSLVPEHKRRFIFERTDMFQRIRLNPQQVHVHVIAYRRLFQNKHIDKLRYTKQIENSVSSLHLKSLQRMATTSAEVVEILQPDDWHQHFRDGDRLKALAPLIAKQFHRCIVMPNLKPPVVTTEDAARYKQEIIDALPEDKKTVMKPLMTLYLTDNTTPEEIEKAKESGIVFACKLYPAGATTNSDSGVTDMEKIKPTLAAMAEHGILLLVHSEVTDPDIDIFDREKAFIDRHLRSIISDMPKLKVVMEHITTKDAADFVMNGPDNLAATITAHHLLYNRNEIFKGGIRPHMYCLPVLKREKHRQALLNAIRSGSNKFFLGTDSAAHPKDAKESSCGCAGVFTAHAALEFYVQAFEEAGALEHFENFCSKNGPNFYGLPINENKIKLVKKKQQIVKEIPFGNNGQVLVPLCAGEEIPWTLEA